jgi:hypothetical protein
MKKKIEKHISLKNKKPFILVFYSYGVLLRCKMCFSLKGMRKYFLRPPYVITKIAAKSKFTLFCLLKIQDFLFRAYFPSSFHALGCLVNVPLPAFTAPSCPAFISEIPTVWPPFLTLSAADHGAVCKHSGLLSGVFYCTLFKRNLHSKTEELLTTFSPKH